MPTAAKLASAILMGVLGWFAADVIAGHLPPEVRAAWLRPLSAFFGVLVGWRFLGRRLGGGVRSATGLGLSASVALVLVGLVWFSGYEMVRRSLRKSYDDPFEAIQDMFQISVDFFEFLGQADVIAVLAGGGILVGLLAEAVGRRWP